MERDGLLCEISEDDPASTRARTYQSELEDHELPDDRVTDDSTPPTTSSLDALSEHLKRKRTHSGAEQPTKHVKMEDDAFHYKPAESSPKELKEPRIIKCTMTEEQFDSAAGAWIKLRYGDEQCERHGTPKQQLDALLDAHLKLVEWDGV